MLFFISGRVCGHEFLQQINDFVDLLVDGCALRIELGKSKLI